MKARSLVFCLLLAAAFSLPAQSPSESSQETNAPAATIVTNLAPVVVTIPGMDDLLAQMESMRRANDAASERWIELAEQNNALSNVLTGLEQTLVSQKEREVQISKEARSFNIAVLTAAGAGILLVLLGSYWFQLRCMNRVMEMARTQGQLPAPGEGPAMLPWGNARESELLAAVKVLEDRVKQLEAPPGVAAPETPGQATITASSKENENGHATDVAVKLIDVGPPEPEATSTSSKASLLMAKGEILLDMERWQESITCFQEVLAMDPRNGEAHLKKGIALERMNRLEQSLSSYEEALRINPNRAFAHVYKARVLAALHRYDEALNVYDSALGGKAGSKVEAGSRLKGL